MSKPRVKRVAIYCRLSVANEASVSIAQQTERALKYAEAQGWQVVGEPFVDLGVSATYNRPGERKGWLALLASPEEFDAVLVLKIDRLSRKVIDFLRVNEVLQARGAGIVSVTEPIDMTTPEGRAFATMLAVFAEMEADAIRTRVKAARDHLIKVGRVVGGTVPYGWQSIPNPDGNGKVLAQDPGRIEYVREMAKRVLGGDSIYSVVQWLNQEGVPLPSTSQVNRKHEGWAYSTVERLLRSPVLAGMTRYQPGRGRHDTVDPTAVLRDGEGLPVVDESIAILSTEDRRRLLELLDDRDTPQSRPRASKGTTSPLLSRLATCGHCAVNMHRSTTQGRPSLSCPSCHQTISRNQLDGHITGRLLTERGDLNVWEHLDFTQDNSTELADIEQAIQEVAVQMTKDDADVSALNDQLAALKERRTKARTFPPPHRLWRITNRTVRTAWESAQDDADRREVLRGQVGSLRIFKGRLGRYLDPARIEVEWRPPTPDGIPLPDGTWVVETTDLPDGEVVIGGIMLRESDHSLLFMS